MATDTKPSGGTAAGTGTAAGKGTKHTHHSGGTVAVIGDLHLTGQQVSDDLAQAVEGATKARDALASGVPAEFGTGKAVRKSRLDSEDFIADMISVQKDYGTKLGPTKTNPVSMQTKLDVAAAADKALGPLNGLVNLLTDIRNYCVSLAAGDARLVYRCAAFLAQHNNDAELEKAIAKFRDLYSRRSKKAAGTRKKAKEAKAKEVTPPPAQPIPAKPEPHPITTTTTVQT